VNGGFTWIDWAVVLGALVATTLVGGRLAGKQESLRDFFLGGRKLPWYAVSASIVATEISAVTYVSLPSVVFKEGGNLTYLQIGLIGSLLARMIVGYVLVPAYFQREIYSPYDYMGAKLGEGIRRMTTALFSLGGVLGQSARVYLIAVVLEIILWRELGWVQEQLGIDPLVASISVIGVVAIAWTLLGGIAAVIWTDVILFLLFLAGVTIALTTVGYHVDGGLPAAFANGWEAGKFRLLDFDTDPTKAYTFWAALFASTWGGIGFYGTDHLLAQRLFCCKNERDARRAIVCSIAAIGVVFLVALVGIGLFAYYREYPLEGEALALVTAKPDRIFPLFIVEVIPAGFKGLVVAGAFAAAISSLDSILAALSQTSLSTLWLPHRRRQGVEDSPEEARRMLRVSRLFVLGWGVVLCAAAVSMQVVHEHYASILDLALAMASYTGGALVACFFLAFLPVRSEGSGLLWSAPLSVLTVFAIVWHQEWARWLTVILCALTVGLWIIGRLHPAATAGGLRRELPPLAALLIAIGVILAISSFAFASSTDLETGAVTYRVLAWPWYIPAGSSFAFLLGLLLRKPVAAQPT
jgi:solute:Na+ symporter, SSS family